MPVDLHTHSTASDGSDTPTELVNKAARVRLDAIAVTDHDTLEGLAEAIDAGHKAGIEVVGGTELSLDWERGGMHMVVLWLEPGDGPLQGRLGEIQASRAGRNERIIERLQELGYDITLGEIVAEAGGGSVGRPHIATVLVRKGYVADIQGAFDDLLAHGRPAYVDRYRLTPEEGIRLARASGGVPVRAHPHTLGTEHSSELSGVLERLVNAGLIGMECHYGSYEGAERDGLEATARSFGLIPSGGSDYHGKYKADVALGTGKVGLAVPDRVLDELKAARAALE